MTYLEVPGANIYYEVVGQGPVLLCISGADGSCEIWRYLAEELKDRFMVVMWDRRGFSRSHLNGAQDYSQRLETDADDAARLIEHTSPGKPATVIGNSSGAIVALRLLTRHSELIRTLLSYEAPATKLLPDFEELWAFHQDVYNTYRSSGMAPALEKFATLTKINPSMVRGLLDNSRAPFMFSNMQYWFERELIVYPKADFDVENGLGPLKGKLVLVNGELSPRQAYQYRGNVALGEKLGLDVVHFPGEHV